MVEQERCPECWVGGVQEVTRVELFTLARAAGSRLVRIRPARLVSGYWWCPRCLNGGAYFDRASADRTEIGQPGRAPARRTARSDRRLRRSQGESG